MEKDFAKEIIDAAIKPYSSLFVVEWSLSGDNDLRVCVDGDHGVDIEAIVAISRAIEHHPQMDREREDFSLSVSSPGADAPLKVPRQYVQHVGRTLEVTAVRDGKEEKVVGELVQYGRDGIVLRWSAREPKAVGKGKQTVVHEVAVPFADIRRAKVALKF